MSEDNGNVVNMSEAPKKGRGRPKGSPNKPKSAEPAADNPKAVIGDNAPAPVAPAKVKPKNPPPQVSKEPLTDDQQRALFFNHKKLYETRLAEKKEADAAFKNACKLLKSEGTRVSDIKLAITLESPSGAEDLKEQIQRELKVARWVGSPVGTQFSLLDEIDRTPIDERVREDGKRSGLKGEPNVPPRTLPGNLASIWQDGYNEGQEILASRFKQKPEDDEAKSAIDDTLPEAAAE